MNLDWLNSNSLRNYPIKDDLGRVSVDGLFTIPNSLIVDMTVCAPQTSNAVYISRIKYGSTSLFIELSVGNTVFGSFQTSLPLADYNTDITLTPSPSFPGASGIITIGSADELVGLPFGDFKFEATSTSLLMRIYSPGPQGLSWISFTDVKGNANTYTGNVTVIGNSNIQFRDNGGVVYVDAGEGLGLNKLCTDAPKPILTINGVAPDNAGNFSLIADTCVSISDAQYGVVISNPCGEPCLGCDAIASLTTQVNRLESSILDIRNFSINLQTVITQVTNLMSINNTCN